MKRLYKLSAILSSVALMLSVASCSVEELDTAHYDDSKVTLASFGPNPVMRGGQLRFFGSNLDQIKSVEVPGVGSITSIEVTASGKLSEIRVTLPVEGPEVGYVVLTDKDGKTYQTVSQLTYTEPIVLDGFDAPNPAFPGDVVTIKGDYMNLVKTVQFAGTDKIDVEADATRHEVKVIIPSNATTGKLVISDGGAVENIFYTEEALVMGEPTVKASAKATLKAGAEITITGEHLEMIEKIVLEGATIDDFILSEDGTSIVFTLPESAGDGAVKAVSFAGKEYEACTLTTVVPTITKVSPKPVKAGKDLTIEGKDLDLVTNVAFDGEESAAFSYAEGKITVIVSPAAKEGKVTLSMANSKSVDADFTLVHPTISSVAPKELYAGDEVITVKGTDLDLATAVTLGGKEVGFKVVSETALELTTDPTSVGGKVEISLANGEKVTSADAVTLLYHALVNVTSMNKSQHIGQEVVILGSNLKLVETIYIGSAKVTDYSIRTDNEIRFLMPWNYVGEYDVDFHLYNGDIETQPNKIGVELEQDIKTIWTGSVAAGGWASAMQDLSWGKYDWQTVSPGTKIVVSYSIDPKKEYGAQMRFGNGSWGQLPSTKAQFPGADGDGNIGLADGTSYISFTLTAADLEMLKDKGGLVLCGAWWIATEVKLVKDIPQENTIWEGSQKVAWDDNASFLDTPGSKALAALAYGAFDWSKVDAGTKLTVYYNTIPEAGYSQLRFGNGNWSSIPSGKAFPGADGDGNINLDSDKISITLTADDIAELTANNGLVLCGNGYEITKVTLL